MPPRKPSTAKKADSAAAKQKKARKPTRTKAASEGIAPAVIVGEAPRPISTGGRPSWMNVPEYAEEMCARVLELGEQGYSECEISAEIGVPRGTMWRWADERPNFRAALTRAKELEQSWWERQARTSLKEKDFNANLWNKSMSARFKSEYGDKLQVGGDQDAPIKHKHDIAFVIVDPSAD